MIQQDQQINDASEKLADGETAMFHGREEHFCL